ncbi:probable UDP-3-O-acyl-N-acetylglucosamine deacetylase 2, mitochondrial, partial [Tanacetum coccineum]
MKQAVVASKEFSNSNPFDVLNLVDNDDDLGKVGANPLFVPVRDSKFTRLLKHHLRQEESLSGYNVRAVQFGFYQSVFHSKPKVVLFGNKVSEDRDKRWKLVKTLRDNAKEIQMNERNVQYETVEHLLLALEWTRVDNCRIEIVSSDHNHTMTRLLSGQLDILCHQLLHQRFHLSFIAFKSREESGTVEHTK